jgi:hypothetical protein
MDKRIVTVVIALSLALAAVLPAGAVAAENSKEVAYRLAMRDLWDAHVTRTWTYIISAMAGLPDAGKAASRLLRNQDDIGAALMPYYGEPAGKQLAGLLRDHISIAAAVVGAAKAGDTAKTAAEQKKWSANVNTIAAFLSGANPNWTRQALADMLYEHLRLTTEEAVARIKMDYDMDIMTFEKIHEQAMMMADALSAGIIKQFPDKFK